METAHKFPFHRLNHRTYLTISQICHHTYLIILQIYPSHRFNSFAKSQYITARRVELYVTMGLANLRTTTPTAMHSKWCYTLLPAAKKTVLKIVSKQNMGIFFHILTKQGLRFDIFPAKFSFLYTNTLFFIKIFCSY